MKKRHVNPFPTPLVVILSVALLGIAVGLVAQSALTIMASALVAGLVGRLVWAWVRL